MAICFQCCIVTNAFQWRRALLADDASDGLAVTMGGAEVITGSARECGSEQVHATDVHALA